MTTSYLKMEVQPPSKALCVSSKPQTMDNVQHNICTVSWFPMYAACPTCFTVFELITDLIEPLYQNVIY
jgi:hypothetical protein